MSVWRIFRVHQVQGKSLFCEINVAEQINRHTKFKTTFWLNPLQWQEIDQQILEFANENAAKLDGRGFVFCGFVQVSGGIDLKFSVEKSTNGLEKTFKIDPFKCHPFRLKIEVNSSKSDEGEEKEPKLKAVEEFQKLKIEVSYPYLLEPMIHMFSQRSTVEPIPSTSGEESQKIKSTASQPSPKRSNDQDDDNRNLFEKYNCIDPPPSSSLPEAKKVKRTRNRNPHPAAKMTKEKLAEQKAEDEARAARIETLERQRVELVKKNEILAEVYEKCLKPLKKERIIPPRPGIFMLPLYDKATLEQKFGVLFKVKASELFGRHVLMKNMKCSKFNLTWSVFAETQVASDVLVLLQETFGREDDSGKYTNFFSSVLMPEFLFTLFRDEFKFNVEDAEKQIDYQNQEQADKFGEEGVDSDLSS